MFGRAAATPAAATGRGIMSETEKFLAATMPRLTEAEIAIHNGDAGPRIAMWSRDEPVTLQGWDGYALDVQAPTGEIVMMRTYIVKDRLYRLLVTAKSDMRTRSAGLRFIDSLRLAETRG